MVTTHDPKCRELAEAFLLDYHTVGTRTRAQLEESLANEIQGAIEGWLEDAEQEGQIHDGPPPDAKEG